MKLAVKILLNLLVILSLPLLILGGLTAAKIVSPLIVISGSMEPEIHVGSLIISTTVKAKDLHVGDIASFKREDGVLVTHRIISNEAFPGNENLRTVRMKGDANNAEDRSPYIQSDALKPLLVVPNVGSTMAAVGNHKMSIVAALSFGIAIWLAVKLFRGGNSTNSANPSKPKRGRRSASSSEKDEKVLSNQ